MSFRVIAACPQTAARAGELATAHGPLPTPAFMPVGTQATVKSLDPRELAALGARCLLANTYHLALRPGAETVRRLGGLHRFMSWDGPLLTDSGGFQVWSLAPLRAVTAEGVEFRSHLDGAPLHFTPENVVATQQALGADIIMPLDVCLEYPAERAAASAALDTTDAWLRRAIAVHDGGAQQLFGIVQGAMYADLRRQAARALAALDLPGYAIGGLSVGEPKATTAAMLAAVVPELPADRPRYLMGVGSPEDLLMAAAHGVDMFDCTLPTRMARAGGLLTRGGRLNLRNARFRADPRPPVEGCACPTCTRWSMAALHWLFIERHALGGRLATLHNLHFLITLLAEARAAIARGDFPAYHADFLRTWVAADQAVGREQRRRWRESHYGPPAPSPH